MTYLTCIQKALRLWGALILVLTAAGTAVSAQVDVFAESVVRDNELIVYLYADVHTDHLVSYGVSLNYDPAQIRVVEALKEADPLPYTGNETRWFIGSHIAHYRNDPPPDTSEAGRVVFVGGRIDPAAPDMGVQTGEKVFLGMVRFGPAGASIPAVPDLMLSYAREDLSGGYKNFVRLSDGAPQAIDGDDVSFSPVEVFEPGDANGDGFLSPTDINAVKRRVGDANGPCHADCNGDGAITPNDINCIKTKL